MRCGRISGRDSAAGLRKAVADSRVRVSERAIAARCAGQAIEHVVPKDLGVGGRHAIGYLRDVVGRVVRVGQVLKRRRTRIGGIQ